MGGHTLPITRSHVAVCAGPVCSAAVCAGLVRRSAVVAAAIATAAVTACAIAIAIATASVAVTTRSPTGMHAPRAWVRSWYTEV